MDGTECSLGDGDVIYRGCDLEHWREACEGGKNYRLGQVFLHYINKDARITLSLLMIKNPTVNYLKATYDKENKSLHR